MATSETAICNLSLGWLGANLIMDMDDASVEAQLCKANYDASRDATLEARNWTFAVGRKILSPLAEEPEFGYGLLFQLPANCMRVIRAGNDPDFYDELDWEVESDKLLADRTPVYIRYIAKVTNTLLFSAGFDQALAAHLASVMAIPLTNSTKLQEKYEEKFIYETEEAGAKDGMQGKSERTRARGLTRIR